MSLKPTVAGTNPTGLHAPQSFGCRLGPREYCFSRPQCVHFRYGPVTRNLPWGGLVDRLRRFCCHLARYPNYGALTFTPAGLSPAEHASLRWTHNHTVKIPRCLDAASYSPSFACSVAQFVTRYRGLGMWWRCPAWYLNGTVEGSREVNGLPHACRRPFTCNRGRLHATRSPESCNTSCRGSCTNPQQVRQRRPPCATLFCQASLRKEDRAGAIGDTLPHT